MQKCFNNAKWITCSQTKKGAAVCFYKQFDFSKKIKNARLVASAIGVYDVFVDGQKIDKNYLKPGVTSYRNRLFYQTFSLTEKLASSSQIKIEVAPGWAVGRAMYPAGAPCDNLVSDHTLVIACLSVEYEDGSKESFVTDDSWNACSSCVVFSDIYDGEIIDYTLPIEQFGKAEISSIKTNLVKQVGAGVTENEVLMPIKKFITPKGEKVVDFGQNMTGVVQINFKGKFGDRIFYTCAEVLDSEGNFYNENYRSAKSAVSYVLDGKERQLKPKFTFQGFRYIRFDECPENFFESDVQMFAIVMHTKLKRTGNFVCGNEKINQLYHNIIWGQKCNYLDIPTDCPQRDERLGWTGDAQVFCRTAAYNFNVSSFFKKWLADVRIEQGEQGEVFGVVPQLVDTNLYKTRISAGWGDCITIIPWELYKVYGDKSFLSQNYNAMRKWIKYIQTTSSNPYLWLGGYHYGDWLAMDKGMEDSYVGATANDLIATAFYAYSVSILIKTGKVLGKKMIKYQCLLNRIKKEFRKYFMPNGKLKDDYPLTEICQEGKKQVDIVRKGLTQTALTLILKFDICKENEKEKFAKMLDDLIEENNGRMSTGFLGTPYLLHALTESGNVKRAYNVFFREDNPSWLYSVNHGATTMWEHWNGIKEDGSFWSKSMNSFNHYAYGAVGAWMYEIIAGIQMPEDSAGFEKIVLAPTPDERLGFVKCSIKSVKGKIKSEWKYTKKGIKFAFSVPDGVIAQIKLPNGFETTITGGEHKFFVAK